MPRASDAFPESDWFEKGWTRSKGRAGGRVLKGSPFGQHRQMARAAAGNRAAVFRLVPRGGCRTAQQLQGQLEYVWGKASAVLDSRGTYEGQGPLGAEDARAAAERWADGWEGATRTGQTSHMVMSFPIGTKPEAVQKISERICERFFDGRYDYVAAVHTDRAHPHTHIIVNRRGFDGDLFTLRAGTEYSYQAFKEAMVEIGAQHGVALEASARLERGIVARAPTVEDYRKGRTADVPREGADLAYAVRQVAQHAQTYGAMAAQARAMVQADLASAARGETPRGDFTLMTEALDRAADTLAAGKILSPAAGTIPMDQQTRFADALRKLDVAAQQATDRIEQAAPSERPAMEAQLHNALSQLSGLNPHGARSADLARPPSEDGIYSRPAAQAIERDGAKLDRALEGTGIDPEEVAARMHAGAPNAALERQWIAEDVRAVANERSLDLQKSDQFAEAMAEVDRVHDRIADDLGLDAARTQPARDATAAGPEAGAAATAARDRDREIVEAQSAADRVSARGAATKSDLSRIAAPVSEADAARYRAAVEERLSASELDRLKRGDVSGLAGAGTREDQLTIAREYLKAEGHSPDALRQVTQELRQEQETAHDRRGHAEGLDHG